MPHDTAQQAVDGTEIIGPESDQVSRLNHHFAGSGEEHTNTIRILSANIR